MFDQAQKDVALSFARAVAAKDYAKAYGMLSASAQSRTKPDQFRADVEQMLPPELGRVEPIEIVEDPAWADTFIYVALGGEVYSEAVMVEAVASEDGVLKVDRFQFGRP